MSDPNSNDFQTLFPEPDQRTSDEDLRHTGIMRDVASSLPKTRADTPREPTTRAETNVPKGKPPGKSPSDPPSSQILTAASPASGTATGQATSEEDPVEGLRARLLGLELITQQQWQAALDRLDGPPDVLRILNELQRVESHRDGRGGGRIPALTAFQVEQILAGNTDRLRLQHYIVLERLGAGGMGEVFKAWNLNLERLEAIKTIIQVDTGEGTSGSTQGLARFEQEARVLAQLDHDCITTIYHAGREHGLAFIAMEFVAGENMKDIVDSAFAEGDPVPIWWAVERGMAIASALQHAHSKGVIHRDVKPSNVMITDKGELKVLDMGIARLARRTGESTGQTSGLTQDRTGLGTPEVMPPEQWADATAVTPASDIYSLGCTLFFILTGRMPFEATTLQGYMFAHLNDPPPKPSSLRPEIPPGLDRVVLKMLAKKEEDRYSNCAELLEALAPFAKQIPNVRNRNRSKVVWAAMAGCLMVVAIAGIYSVISFVGEDPKQDDPKKAIVEKPEQPEPEQKQDTKPLVDSTKRSQELEKWLADYQKQHTAVWPSLDVIRSFAKSDSPNILLEENGLEKVIDKVKQETAGRWKQVVDAKLRELQQKHADVWDDPEKLARAAALIRPLDTIQNSKQLDDLLKAMEQESWERKLNEWIASYQMTHTSIWESRELLKEFIDKEFPGRSMDQALFAKIGNAVRRQTRNLIDSQRENWLRELQKANADVWPDLDELRIQAGLKFDRGSITDDSSFDAFKETMTGLTQSLQRPFEGISTAGIGDQAERYRVQSLLNAYQWLLSLPEETKDPEWDFELRFTVDGKEFTGDRLRLPTNKQVVIDIKPKQAGYATLFFRSSTGSHLLLRSFKAVQGETPEQYEANEWQLLTWPTTDVLGMDRFAVYYTNVDPFTVDPKPLPAAVERAEKTGDIFASRFFLLRDVDGGALQEFKVMFKDPLVFKRIEDYLLSPKPYPTLEPNRDVKHWNMKYFEIEVIR